MPAPADRLHTMTEAATYARAALLRAADRLLLAGASPDDVRAARAAACVVGDALRAESAARVADGLHRPPHRVG